MHSPIVLACGPGGAAVVLVVLLAAALKVALPALGLIAVVKLATVAWLKTRPAAEAVAPFPAVGLAELEGADEDLRQAHRAYLALLAAVEQHQFAAAPDLELDRADDLARRAEEPLARAAPRLAAERAQALGQMRAAVASAREALVGRIARSARRLGVAPAPPRTELGALALLEGGPLFCGARRRAWVVGALLVGFVTRGSALPLPALVTAEGLRVVATWLAVGAAFVLAAWLRPGVGRVALTGVSLFGLASVLLSASGSLWWPSLLPAGACFVWWARSRLSGPPTA